MEIKNIRVIYDINRNYPPKRVTVTHVNDINSRVIELTLMQSDHELEISEGCTAGASIVERHTKRLINDSVACTVNEDGNILIPIDDLHTRNRMDINIEVTVYDSSNTQILTLPYPLWVRVNPSILDDAEVYDDSLGTIPELLEEAREIIEGERYVLTEDDKQDIAGMVNISGKEDVIHKKSNISNQSQTGDSDTNYPTVGAVRNYTNTKVSDLEDYVNDELDDMDSGKADKSTTYTKSEVDSLVNTNAKSAYEIAVDHGYTGTEQEWIASLHAANPVVLPLSVYSTEASAIEYMDNQQDKSIIYVWNNKLYIYCTRTVQGLSGACLYEYRNSASSGLVAAENRSTLIIPVSSFEAPLTIDYTGFAISSNPYIYGGNSPTVLNKTLISNDGYVGRTAPIEITSTQLQGCTYVAMIISTTQRPSNFSITVNGTTVSMTVITSTSEIESAMGSGSITVTGYADSGVDYASTIGDDQAKKYLDQRGVYLLPPPRVYCETKAIYESGVSYLSKYNLTTMMSMFSTLASSNTAYVTETTLGKDQSNTYNIKKYVLDAPSSILSGYTSSVTDEKPTIIITSGLHGEERDAVHEVYHFMDDLCNHFMESETLLYLHNNVRFVIVPICNPWGYACTDDQHWHYNSRDVDLNKNFEYGYRNNGSDKTGTAAYSEAETQLLKGVFDEYSDAIFHLECHGKYGEDTAFDQTIWFSLMSSLNSELIELCADNLNSKIGMRLKGLGYNTNNSTGGYITNYGLNGRPKDYTGTKYGMLSATMEGTGKIYGESGYSVNTQKINTEALENFLLTVLSGFESGLSATNI